MSIETVRELETLASVCPELNMANYTEDDVRHLNDWAIEMSLLVERYALSQQPDNAACKSVQKRLAAQQPATAIACGIPGMAKTTCPYCEQGFAFEHAQPATGEPVVDVRCEGCGYMTHHREHMGCVRAAKQHTHQVPSVPDDVVRVPLQVLKDASEALGNFVSDHGWGDADMQAMDNLDAYIARHAVKDAK